MKAMLIGLDGATWTKLEKWIEMGELPTISKIYREYGHGTMLSTIPSYTCPAIPTLVTGKNQAKTGIFDFFYPDGTPVTLKTMKHLKLWNILDINGKTSCIVNLRMAFPVEKLNGIMISGNPATSEDSDYVYPPELKERIRGFKCEEINNLSEELTIDPQRNKEIILNYRITMTKNRYKVFKELNLEKDYDFSLFWIGGTDFMQHWFWDDDETLLRYFREVDHILRDITETFTDRNIVIISDHGCQPRQNIKFYLNAWLEREGYLYLDGNLISRGLRKLALPLMGSIFSKKTKNRLQRLVDKLRSKSEGQVQEIYVENFKSGKGPRDVAYNKLYGIDWIRTKAYLKNHWGIGIINAKDLEYETLRENIIRKLKLLEDKNGKRIIKEAWKREDLFHGPYLNQVPDIVFLTSEEYAAGALPSFKITGRLNKDSYEITEGRFFRGDHEGAIEAILMAHGPDIKKGFCIGRARIMDIMPTILHMLGVDLPD
ncbi:MAG: alkaline phosphatase family protein, partial [Nitrospirota bacterium]